MKEIPHYATLVLFGKEHPQSVISPHVFREIVGSLSSFLLGLLDCPLLCRGVIYGNGVRNIAPRRSRLSEKTLLKWVNALSKGRFHHFSIFDVAVSKDTYPTVYASLHKLGPPDYTKTPSVGAENHVVIAVQRHLLSEGLLSLEHYAKALVPLLSVFYGFIEYDVQWMQVHAGGAYYSDLIDMRWHDRGWNGYRGGTYRMDEWIPRLYWGNMLLQAHFKDGDPDNAPLWAVEQLGPICKLV